MHARLAVEDLLVKAVLHHTSEFTQVINFSIFCSLLTLLLLFSGEKPFKCNYCLFKTANRTHLKRHITTHLSKFLRHFSVMYHYLVAILTDKKPYKCEFCHKTNKSKDSLSQHKKMNQQTEEMNCHICEFSSFYKCGLKFHMDSENHTQFQTQIQ